MAAGSSPPGVKSTTQFCNDPAAAKRSQSQEIGRKSRRHVPCLAAGHGQISAISRGVPCRAARCGASRGGLRDACVGRRTPRRTSPRYYVGYRTSPTGTETRRQTSATCTHLDACSDRDRRWQAPTISASTPRTRPGLRSAPSNEVSTTIPTTPPPPSGGGLTLERGALNFGAVQIERLDGRTEDAGTARDGHARRPPARRSPGPRQRRHRQHPPHRLADERQRHGADHRDAWPRRRSPPAPTRTP